MGAFIFQLPDELSVSIVQLTAIRPDDRPDSCDNGVVLRLSRVYHRLRRLSQPIFIEIFGWASSLDWASQHFSAETPPYAQ
jgi:hypothetical protein